MQALHMAHKAATELSCSQILRLIGQSLEHMDLKGFELKRQDEVYFLQGWHRGGSIVMGVKERYTSDDLVKLELENQKKRGPGAGQRDPLSIAQLLRTAGNYVDFIGGRLLRVEWQYQSDKVQSITIQYEPSETERLDKDFPLGATDEVTVHVYRERKKVRPLSVKPVFSTALP